MFQILCHCDISVNCPLYAFFDTFKKKNLLTYSHDENPFNQEKGKYSKLGCILNEILTVLKFRVIVTYQ